MKIEDSLKIIKEIPVIERMQPSGSYFYTGNTSSDIDVIVLCKNPEELLKFGFFLKRSYTNGSQCWRSGNIDLVVVRTLEEFNTWVSAAVECRRVKADKKLAIEIHRRIVGT